MYIICGALFANNVRTVTLPLCQCYMDSVVRLLPDLCPYILAYSYDMARRTHLNELTIVWFTVKSRSNRYAGFAERLLHVKRNLNVGCIHVRSFHNDRIEFVCSFFRLVNHDYPVRLHFT